MQHGLLCELEGHSSRLQVQLIALQVHVQFTTCSIIPANACICGLTPSVCVLHESVPVLEGSQAWGMK